MLDQILCYIISPTPNPTTWRTFKDYFIHLSEGKNWDSKPVLSEFKACVMLTTLIASFLNHVTEVWLTYTKLYMFGVTTWRVWRPVYTAWSPQSVTETPPSPPKGFSRPLHLLLLVFVIRTRTLPANVQVGNTVLLRIGSILSRSLGLYSSCVSENDTLWAIPPYSPSLVFTFK